MKISSLAVDKKKEEEGVWSDIGEGAKILVARSGNSKYQECLRLSIRPHQNRLRRNSLPDDVLENLTINAMSRHILLDWSGILDDQNEPITHSIEMAKDLLTDYPEFREIVSSASSDFESYKLEQIEEISGN